MAGHLINVPTGDSVKLRLGKFQIDVFESGGEPLVIVHERTNELYRVFSDLGANIVKVRCLDELGIDAGSHTWRSEVAHRELNEAARSADAGQ